MVVQALQLFSQVQSKNTLPLIVVAQQDIGKVLGMELQPHMQQRELAIIDEVKTQSGDYIDIGQPFLMAQPSVNHQIISLSIVRLVL